MSGSTIAPIDGNSIHRIQSGQVIVDLCSVVKELVENSLDAQATAVDVKFKGQGLDAIEIQDNGTGISKDNYTSIALKHHTSKLRTFEDLSTLNTFGFRGEALSSLCALSDVHIVTATQDDVPKGSRLDFESSGQLIGTSITAAQRGTAVVIESIFKNLPVRQQELRRNIKREYTKVINLLQAYACISTGTKFVVTNVSGKKKTQVFATQSNKTTRENITNVFGHKAASSLTALNCEFEMQSRGRAFSEGNRFVKIEGHVSRPVIGEGRQTPDRQMFFVNSRPCKLPQVAKAINEVYKGYNLNQSPFVFANVIMDTNAYDVNVSPDKREILLHDQDNLIEALKSSISQLFGEHQQTVPQIHKPSMKQTPYKLPQTPNLPSKSSVEMPQRDTSSPTISNPSDTSSPQPQPRASSPMVVEALSSPTREHAKVEQSREFSNLHMAERFVGQRSRDSSNKTSHSASHSPHPPQVSFATALADMRHLSPSQNPDISTDDFDLAEDAAEGIEAGGARLQQFTDRLREHHQASEFDEAEASNIEQPIPSVQSSPFKSSSGVVPNAFERMRPWRSPRQATSEEQTAGWRTSNVQPMGGRSSKRQKTAHQRFSSSLRSFAAPGTRASPNTAGSTSGEASPESDSFKPDWPRRESNRRSRQTQLSPTRSSAEQSFIGTGDEESEDEELVEVSKGISTHRESIASESNHSEDPEAKIDDESDGEWLDEDAKKAKEEVKVQKLIREAEERAAQPTQDNVKRAQNLLRGGHKDATTNLVLDLQTSFEDVQNQFRAQLALEQEIDAIHARQSNESVDASTAEERLSLTVSKADFGDMQIVGQFNLGFILATRSGDMTGVEATDRTNDELFIIDQHASDEKFNFERLTSTTVLQNQRLVQPQPLELTAVERELVSQHQPALVRNGFVVSLHQPAADDAQDNESDDNGDGDNNDNTDEAENEDLHVGPSPRATLLSLPASREVTFSVSDLEELLALLPDDPNARPAKVRRLLAMRACRSSIMIGKALTKTQMRGVVRNLGGLDKPWNCPHGRPTMRHLVGLGDWVGWDEESGVGAESEKEIDWKGWVEQMQSRQ